MAVKRNRGIDIEINKQRSIIYEGTYLASFILNYFLPSVPIFLTSQYLVVWSLQVNLESPTDIEADLKPCFILFRGKKQVISNATQ